jgi:hypothetical protein
MKIGDSVFRSDSGREYEVLSVGRKWATFGVKSGVARGRIGRFDLLTREIDGAGYSSPGIMFSSVEEMEEAKKADRVWRAVQSAIGQTYHRPKHLHSESILAAAALLHLDLGE